MATIRTAIQIQDGLSQAFRSMNVAMQATINSFEHLERSSGNAIDTSSIEIARRELARTEQAFEQIETQIREADQQQDRFNSSMREGTSAANALLSKLLAIAGTYLSIRSVLGIVGLSDQMIDTAARLDLMNDGLQTTIELQRMIYDSAQRTYAPYQATADMVGKLGMQARDAFGSNREIVAFAEQLNKTFAVAGTSVVGMESVMLQLTQAMAAGKLQGEELNAILDNAQPIVANIQRYLEDAFNIDASNIKKLASDGVITAEIIKNAMFYAAEETNAAFDSMPLTWGQIWTKMKNFALDAFTPILLKINEVANSERMQGMIASVSNSLYTLAGIATVAFEMFASAGAFVYDNWSLIAPILGTATAAVMIYVGALTAMKLAKMASVAWTTLSSTVTLIYAAALGTGTGATWAMVGASLGLNAALAANPIFWVIMAVVILIGLLYAAVATINHFAGTSLNATGIVAGAFMVLGTYIYNQVAFWWNIFASVAEFFVNVWQHPMFSVKKMFGDLATNFLDNAIAMSSGWDGFATAFVNAVIKAVNMAINAWNKFIEILPDGVAGTLGLSAGNEYSYRESITSDLSNLKDGINDWIGEPPSDYWEAPKMEIKPLKDARDTGYNWGSNLFGDDPREKKENEKNPWEDILNGAKDLEGLKNDPAGKETAKNTAKMAKSMDGTANELKYLRDLAERESINRYTTAEIKVDMKNENHINSEMDIDGVIDRFGEKVEEVVTVLAEGDSDDV